MMNHTLAEQRRLVASLNDRGLWEKRYEVCTECLKRPVRSTAELSSDEIRKVTNDLNSDEQWGWADFGNAQHLKILSLCYPLKWIKFNEKLGRIVADPEKLGRWLKYYSAPKKPLKQCNTKELGQIIFAMEDMMNNKYAK